MTKKIEETNLLAITFDMGDDYQGEVDPAIIAHGIKLNYYQQAHPEKLLAEAFRMMSDMAETMVWREVEVDESNQAD